MELKQFFLNQLEAEAKRTRRAIEAVPDGHVDWVPHGKSMPFGRLAMLVAGMPAWVPLIVDEDSLDLNPPGGGSNYQSPPMDTREQRVQAVVDNVAKGRAALEATNDALLLKPWQLKVAGKVVSEDPKYVVLRDTFAHLAHHRGQLTVYLRLLDAKVPAIYGPSADDQRFD